MAKEFKVPENMPQVQPIEVPDRLTINLMMFHEHHGDSPHQVQSVMWGCLETKDQTWSRRGVIGETPEPIPLGWFTSPERIGYIVLENLEGRTGQVRPTKAEQDAVAGRVIQIGCLDDGPGYQTGLQLLVKPGWPQPLFPSTLNGLTMRCLSGTAQYRLTIFPR